ncbi:2-hydroxyacid dehydrogenase [Rhodobacterales bacterium HKCCE2091]|nr:2-hydroxyacid dehydrogenase [Rhodobacterales bacterium HKCCE2091]
MSQSKPMLALFGQKLAPDVCAALEPDFTLVRPDDLPGLDPAAREGIERAVTMAMIGAPAELLEALPGLKRIASIGAGMDQFDEADLAARGIELCPTPHIMTEDTAEMAVSLVFALFRNTVANDAHVRTGRWAGARASLGRRISGSRAGIVGLGRIGSAVARRLRALGVDVAYTGRAAKPGAGYPFVADVAELAAAVDVLILTCAATPETRKLADARVIAALGPEGFLVNVSRGSVVDEPALIAALSSGGLRGAALDVFENEPGPDPRFRALDNIILSPHAAVFTAENRVDLIAEIGRLVRE